MISELRRPIHISLVAQTLPRSAIRLGSTIRRVSHEYGDHNPSRTSYFLLLGAGAVGCGALSFIKYLHKDKNFVDIKNNANKSKFDERTNQNYPVQAWPNIEHALIVLFGYEIISYLALTLNSLKFAEKSLGTQEPNDLKEVANTLESKLKTVLADLISYSLEQTSIGDEARLAINSLNTVVQSPEKIPWESLDKEFFSVDWTNEKPHKALLNPEQKALFLKKMKHISYEANMLERSVELYLTGKR